MRSPIMRAGALLVSLAAVAVAAAPLEAAQYPGRGETGWCCYSKRQCCDEAIALAHEASAANCEMAGGTPRPSGARRGSCNWEWIQDEDGNAVYRCLSEAAVRCR
jgi:hypothetical protein